MVESIPAIKLEKVAQREAKELSTYAIVGRPSLREVSNGYVQVTVPLHYVNGADPSEARSTLEPYVDTVVEAYQSDDPQRVVNVAGLQTFFARWNIRPEWLTESFQKAVKNGLVSESELTQFRINVAGLTYSLFKQAGLDEINFASDELIGKIVPFYNRPRKDDPTRAEIGNFSLRRRSR